MGNGAPYGMMQEVNKKQYTPTDVLNAKLPETGLSTLPAKSDDAASVNYSYAGALQPSCCVWQDDIRPCFPLECIALYDDQAATYENWVRCFDLVYARSSDRGTDDKIDVADENELAYNLIRSGTWD